ncbi:LOW QUALITY PROTEIN: hypothetical protein NC653_019317 [Populus alba x Populus x berolinensis]|nr:LOW QUALITY PROTEIN: hypothetical protein NC653_019317 [Populus alba x Populus x berolinensis]
MAGLFDKQADLYLDGRPTYPAQWYSMLADHTLHHSLAWDVGTGNGQAALGVAEHYEQVIGTDVSEAQLKRSMTHPRVRYFHTPLSMSDDEIISLIGGEDSVDLVTVAQAVHWFDLPKFYSLVERLLRKPGGLLAVWCYNDAAVSPAFDSAFKRFHDSTLPFWHPNAFLSIEGYKRLPFPFESIGLGSEGKPLELDIPKEMSFEGLLKMISSWSAVVTAKDQGVDLLSPTVVKELETVWGGSELVRSVICKAFMLAGKVRLHYKPMTQLWSCGAACRLIRPPRGFYASEKTMSLAARPRYPGKWFSRLAALTPHRYLAWDIGTGTTIGCRALKPVTQVKNSKSMLCHMPKFSVFTPHYQMSDDQLADIIGGGNSVDLVTVAAALQWFDLGRFYPIVKRNISEKPGLYSIDCYKKLPFPFEGAVTGIRQAKVDVTSFSPVNTAKRQIVDLLSEEVVKELEGAWDGSYLVRTVN